MLEGVAIKTAAGAVLTLPLEDVTEGYLIESIDGLDPVKAVLVSSSFARMDGEQFQSARRESRNILLKVGLDPDYTVDDTVQSLRRRLSTYLMPKSEVTLTFSDEDKNYDIKARVETFETALFTREPQVNISLVCFDPDFVDPAPTVVPALSTVNDNSEILIDYEGTVETGIELTLNVNRALGEFTVYHRPADGTVRTLDFAESLVAGDILKISTVAGNKYIRLTRNGSTSSMLRGRSPQSNWVELQNGENHIRVYALGAPIPYSLAYTTRYGGL